MKTTLTTMELLKENKKLLNENKELKTIIIQIYERIPMSEDSYTCLFCLGHRASDVITDRTIEHFSDCLYFKIKNLLND